MSGILTVAERVWDYLGPGYAELRKTVQYFEIGEHLSDAVDEIAKDITTQRDDLGNGVIPQDARLPAPYTVLWFPDMKDNMMICSADRGEPHKTRVTNFSAYMAPLVLGGFEPGSVEAHVNDKPADDEEGNALSYEVRAQLVVYAAASLALINTPRLVRLAPAGSRQARRAVSRKTGADAAHWHRLEWDLAKPVVRADERMGSGRHMPLHYTRGHWRQSDKAKIRAHVRADGRTYQWIEGYWSGHPAYGIKRAVYAPKIGETA